jgi:hypothetical protein
MWRFRPVPFGGSVTTNASRVPSGENCKSEIDRKFSEASGVNNLLLSAVDSVRPPAVPTHKPANNKTFAEIRTP